HRAKRSASWTLEPPAPCPRWHYRALQPMAGGHTVGSAEIREALGAARAYVSQHPEEARYTDSTATAILNEGLAVTISGPDGATIQTDMPQSVGGNGAAPSPGWLLRAAQASCVAT